MIKNKRVAIIDIFRLIGCIMIMFIHISPLLIINQKVNFFISYGVCRIAVPFFFITTSYLFFKNGSDKKKYCYRMLKYYFFWFVASFPIIIYNHFVVGNGGILSKCLLFFRKAVFASTFQGSWFILACIFGALYWSISFKGFDLILSVIALLFFIMNCLSSSYHAIIVNNAVYHLFSTIFIAPSNNLFSCLLFFGIGKYIALNEDRISVINYSPILFCFSIIILFVEISLVFHYNLYASTDGYFSLILISPMAFLVSLKFKNWSTSSFNTMYLSKFTSITYPLHMILLFYINAFLSISHLSINNAIKFFIILLICVITTLFVLKNEKKIKLLKFSY